MARVYSRSASGRHSLSPNRVNESVASASATMVWKSKMCMNPLGSLLFPPETEHSSEKMTTRSANSYMAKIPVPGHSSLAVNLLARAWNDAKQLQSALNLSSASASKKLGRIISL